MPRVAINSAYSPFPGDVSLALNMTFINAHKSVKTVHNAGMKKYDDISEVEKMLSSAEPSEVGNLLSELIRLTNTK